MAFEILFLIGRILVGGYYIFNGFNHFSKKEMMAGYAKSKGVPMPEIAIPLTGLLLLLGGLSLLFGIYPYIGVALIVIFLVPVTFMMHNFWVVPKEQKMADMIQFLKNIALIGSTLMFLAIPTPWPLSLTLP